MNNKKWICRKCGQVVLSDEYPTILRWEDGHRCTFEEMKEGEKYA